ncbi:MAG: hypothetical protein QG644_282 [Patescibacteria group bacterium]|nr:hypothetical protein [Patescibacteria group bacterium]
MSLDEFEKLIKKDKYQIFFFSSPPHLPFFFARHPWFVINKKGEVSRWEILVQNNNCCNKSVKEHLYKNHYPLTRGLGLFPVIKWYWKSELVKYTEGEEGSSAQQMVEFIENSKNTYPYCHKYLGLGPNSNTYAKWILDKFPEFGLKLSWRYVGKDYIK